MCYTPVPYPVHAVPASPCGQLGDLRVDEHGLPPSLILECVTHIPLLLCSVQMHPPQEFDIDKMFGDGENAVIEGGPPSAAEIATRHHQFLNLQSGASSGVMDSAAAIAALTADDDDDMSDSEEYSDDDMDDDEDMAAEDVAALLNRTSAPRSAGAAKPRAKQPTGTFAMRAEESDEDEDSDSRPATNTELLADTAGAVGVGPGAARRHQRAAAKKARKARNRAAGEGEDQAEAEDDAGAAAAVADQPYDFNAYF